MSGTVTNTVISKNYSPFIDCIFAIKKSQENEAWEFDLLCQCM